VKVGAASTSEPFIHFIMLSVLVRQSSKELKLAFNLVPRRNFIFRKKNENMYKLQDKVDSSYCLIYKAPMEYYLLACNHVTTVSALVFGAFCINRYIHRFEPLDTEQKSLDLANNVATMSEYDVVFFSIILVGMCFAIRSILHKYPLRIYKNNNQ
jgi:hypothetical protein